MCLQVSKKVVSLISFLGMELLFEVDAGGLFLYSFFFFPQFNSFNKKQLFCFHLKLLSFGINVPGCVSVCESPVHCETQTRISSLCIALGRVFLSDIELSKGLNVQSGVWGVTCTNSVIAVNGILCRLL